MALCINTPATLHEQLQLPGMKTPDNVKHFGPNVGKTTESTVKVPSTHIESKLVKRRILPTTPPTDVLHRATLINTALVPVYIQPCFHGTASQASAYRTVVPLKSLISLDQASEWSEKLGGLGIPHPDETINHRFSTESSPKNLFAR
jgi:hypothetical protein